MTYNEGVTAYHSNDFASAATAFEQATASPDRSLQQRSLYNLGNARYRMGEADQAHAMPQWERALKSFESALALDPRDEDARFNRDLVKKRIEELKKQQQQQNQENQQNQQQDKQQQKQESKQDQQPSSQNQQQQNQPQPDQQPQQKDRQQQNQEQQDQQAKADQAKQQPQQPEHQPTQPQQSSADNLEKQQAAALLDNLREEEQNWNFFPEVQMKDLKDAGEPAKDW